MATSRRLLEIEAILDTLDPDSPEYIQLDAEANEIVEAINRVEEAFKARAAAEEAERQLKIERIRDLASKGRIDQLITDYGHEFIDDYVIDGNVISSNVSDEQWTEDDVDAKLKQLLYYRIYDHYVRIR